MTIPQIVGMSIPAIGFFMSCILRTARSERTSAASQSSGGFKLRIHDASQHVRSPQFTRPVNARVPATHR